MIRHAFSSKGLAYRVEGTSARAFCGQESQDDGSTAKTTGKIW